MTVQQLRSALDTMPPEAIVVVNMGRNEMANGGELRYLERAWAYADSYGIWHETWGNDDDIRFVVNVVGGEAVRNAL